MPESPRTPAQNTPDLLVTILQSEGPCSVAKLRSYLLGRYFVSTSRAGINRHLAALRASGRVVSLGYALYGLPGHVKEPFDMARWLTRQLSSNPHKGFTMGDLATYFRLDFGIRPDTTLMRPVLDRLVHERAVESIGRRAIYMWAGNPLS